MGTTGQKLMAMMSFKNIWVEYGDNIVLERLSLDIDEGSFVSIVGPSGAGKSTFLRLALGQERPTKGEIYLDGLPLRAEPGPDRGIVFQRYSVFPHLNVLENVIFGLDCASSPILGRSFGEKRRQATEIAKEMLESVGLGNNMYVYATALSGGMQQRLAIAQALVKNPRLLLLDEPFGALDPGISGDMHELVSGLWESKGLTIIMITHDIQEAFKLGTRVISFDKRRHDPQEPHRFGATAVYDMPLDRKNREREQRKMLV